ncbi:uncharacterized protein BDCG_09225 [Blastomyces dermatitidis ER-3]|nr:uncharacterized protein BDCG_09225 [Blastomyces dermatitidis ER-3]EEQ85956.2 hypothetical protein BDCG_09225 [Blastomyces dermatitidis ER-3]EQL32809.1 hypothetical protein BDFG_05061 [Blastomyces dermatitidis ATCC 26199]KMW67930.1 hypothetical protein BDDG_12447 [Blastomyces dermatitidis ATCC 18188]
MMNPTQLWLPGGIAGLLTLSMVVVWTDCLQRLGGVKAWAGSERQSQFRIQE